MSNNLSITFLAIKRLVYDFNKDASQLEEKVEFLTMNQKEGQLMSEHIVNLTKAGQEADVDNMTPEDLKATRLIASCTDKEMRN